MGVAAAVDDLCAGEEAGDEWDHVHVVWLFVGDEAFFGDFVVVDECFFGHVVDDALVVDEVGDGEGVYALGVWE